MPLNTGTSGFTDRMETYLQKKLLLHAVPTLRWYPLCKKGELAAKSNSLTMRFFRRRLADAANARAVTTEGTAVAARTGNPIIKAVDVTLGQIMDVWELTDVVDIIDAYEPLKAEIGAMGEDAGLKCDTDIRNAVITALLNSDNRNSQFAGITPTLDSSADFTSLAAGSAAANKMTRAFALGMKTRLRTQMAPKLRGKYYGGILGAELAHDFVQDTHWMAPSDYSKPEQRWTGEIGMMDGIVWQEADNTFIENNTYNTFDAAGDIYSCFVVGGEAVGCPKMGGTNDPTRPRVNVLDKADKSDPANQKIVAAWKLFWKSVVLNPAWVIHGRAMSTYG